MHPYWSEVQNLFGNAKFPQLRDRLMEIRENRARTSWQALGWKDIPQRGNKVVIGHFPEFMDKARETGAKFLGIAPQVWVTLQRDELRWAVTKQFLDSAWKARSTFILATEVRSPTSYFARELQYLVLLGKAV
jgi:hypothetical protein